MKTDLSPTHIKSIDQIVILWFECSNNYVVISKSAYSYLKSYIKINDSEGFINQLVISEGFESHQAAAISQQFLEVLENSNTIAPIIKKGIKHFDKLTIPKSEHCHFYNFGNRKVEITYGSEIIKGLFHPQLQHCITENNKASSCAFNIFSIGKSLFLFKNNDFVYTISSKEYHLMQGRFAMELTNELHKKNSDDWLATFHASTITDGNEAVMIVGDSGNGKSTLSALLMINGFQLLADDLTPLYAEDLRMYRYPNAISVKKGAFGILEKEYPEFSKLDTHHNGPKNIEIKYLPPFNNDLKGKSNLPCRKIVAVTYNLESPSSFEKITPEQVLATLIPDSWISPNPIHAKKFLNWLSKVEFYSLKYNVNDFAIDSFRSLFKTN